MRLLFVNYECPPVGGGGGVAAANLARELVRLGHSVDYVTTHYRGFARQEEIEGVGLYREPVLGRKDLHTASIISMLSFPVVGFRRGLRLARQMRYDLINTHFAIPTGPAGYLLSKRLKLPHVLTVYGGDIYDPSKPYSPHRHPVLGRVVKKVLHQADLIIAESQDICRRAKELYAPTSEIRRIPLGYCPAPFKTVSREQLGLRSDRLYAISVSRLIPRKAHQDLLQAFSLAKADNLELLIIGDGPEEPRLRHLTAELALKDKVHFLGACDDETKYQYLSVADFFVLSSLHEGFGIVYQEAMHCGLPIVTTNVGGQTDFLEEEVNALLVAPRNPESLAQAIERMATDSELRESMRQRNFKDIKKHSIEMVAKQHLDAFESVLRKKEHPEALA